MTYVGPNIELCGPWVTPDQLCCDKLEYDADQIDTAIEIATQILFKRTGYEYPGICDLEGLRPCNTCGCGCGCSNNCRWDKLKIKTPGNLPVQSIEDVVVDGESLDPSQYYLHGNRYLTHRGEDWPRWPVQDMNLPIGEVGTWSIDITYGKEVPALGQTAAADLAVEFLKNCKKAGCQIPRLSGVEIIRDGVTYVFNGVESGYFNVPTVDVFLRDYNIQGWSGVAGLDNTTMIVEA